MIPIAAGAASGLLLIACFPRLDFGLLAWVALAPFLHQLSRVGPRQGLAAGATLGFVFHSGNLYWVSEVMVQYGGGISRPVSIAILLALVGYLTLFTSAFGALAAAACARGGRAALLATPVLWVGLEFLRNYPLGGFPWCLIGYSQVSFLPVVQVASLAGIYGVSLLVVLVNALFAYWLGRPGIKRASLATAPVALLVAAALAFGYSELARPLPAPVYRVAAVQGNVLQEQKWEPGRAAEIFADHLALSAKAARQGSRLIVWPESSTPFHFDGSPALAERMRAFARERGVYFLFGSDDYEFLDGGAGPSEGRRYRVYNGAKLLAPEGQISLRYHKIHLVPFGEYVPLKPVFFFAGKLVQEVSDFSPGSEISVGSVGEGLVGAFICYEAIYPDLVRRFAAERAGLLVNLTNDAWFGRSSAPYQHFDMAVARAVETRRYLLRAANTGISGLIDPYGRVLAQSDLFSPDLVVGEIAFRSDKSFYVRHGDVLARSAAVVTLIFGAAIATLHFKEKRTSR